MNQMTIREIEYSKRRCKTKREEFLDSMDKIISGVIGLRSSIRITITINVVAERSIFRETLNK